MDDASTESATTLIAVSLHKPGEMLKHSGADCHKETLCNEVETWSTQPRSGHDREAWDTRRTIIIELLNDC